MVVFSVNCSFRLACTTSFIRVFIAVLRTTWETREFFVFANLACIARCVEDSNKRPDSITPVIQACSFRFVFKELARNNE